MAYRGYKHVESVGGVRVADATAFAHQCPKCGEVTLTDRELGMYELRAAAVVLRERHPVAGSVVRYARKAMGLRQTDLARHLGCAAETISRWENGTETMPRQAQLAVVAMLDAVRDGLSTPEQLRDVTSVAKSDADELEVMPLRTACG
jgi:DNA-binding transcriptional regulator YiaG